MANISDFQTPGLSILEGTSTSDRIDVVQTSVI